MTRDSEVWRVYVLEWSQGKQLDTPSLHISASLFALWLPLRVQGTYKVECRVSIFGIVIMIWESIPIKYLGTFGY